MKIQDCKNYQHAANEYDHFVESIQGKGRDEVVATRDHRRALFQEKIKAAENVLMSVMGEDKPSLQRAGIYEFFVQLSSGNYSTTTLFAVTEHICQSTLK